MAEKMKRRISKWDVAELHVETVEHDSVLPAKVDDPCMDLIEVDAINPILSINVHDSVLPAKVGDSRMDHTEVDSINPILSINVHDSVLQAKIDDPRMDITEVDSINPILSINVRDSVHPAKVDDPRMDLTEVDSINPILSKNVHDSVLPAKVDDPSMDITEVDFINPILSINADNSEIKKSDKQPVEERNNNSIHSDDIFEKTQSSEQLDLERDLKNDFKKPDCESVSEDRTMAEFAENQDKPRIGAYDRVPGPEERLMRNSNMSPADDRSRSHRKRSRSRSLSYGSRGKSRSKSRSRSRSRSPSYISKYGSERWTDKGRMRGMTSSCRDFAAGKCTRGNECRFLHDGGGWRETDKHHDAVLTEGRGERHLAYGSKESFIDTREKNNYAREKPFKRHEERHEDGGSSNIPHQGYRSNERCFDFFMGRCQRGSTCRYIHHDASSAGGWSVRDGSRGRIHDRRDDGSASFNRRFEHQRPSDIPCKFFLRGNCLHGDNCKFNHQVKPLNAPVGSPLDGSHSGPAHSISSANASGLKYQTARFRVTNPHGQNGSGAGDAHSIDRQNFTNRSQSESHPPLTRDVHKETQHSEPKTTTPKVCEELSANNSSSTVSIAGKNAESRGQSQFAPQLLLPQNFASNSSFQQFVTSPLPLTGKMQQVMHSHSPQNGKNQFSAVHKPPDDHSLNASYQLNPQNLDPRVKSQQNVPMMSHSGNNFNLNKQFQQNGPLIHTAHHQPESIVGAQIQQNITSHHGHRHQDSIGSRDSQQILPQNLQIQVQNLPLHVSNGKNHLLVAPQPSSNPHIFNSDEKNCELTTKNNSTQIAQAADSVELMPSSFDSDNSITHKVVTSEQAAKIIGLSASLAQFFGATALNSQSSSAITPQAFLNPSSIGSFATTAPPLPTEVEGSQTNLSHSSNPNQQIHAVENVKQVDDSSSKEAKKTEAQESNKEELAQLQNGDAEGKKDGESKKIKDVKEIRMFKCSLVEFVKEILKPKWKEGQLSKEAYKTIVKKVVEKVCGSLQGANVPQTQEKIDLYLLNSKAKLSKLVQAYVEKFVNS